jgi:hypothetical protein
LIGLEVDYEHEWATLRIAPLRISAERLFMPISRQTAAVLMKVIKQCGDGLSDDEFQKIKREIGRVIAVMDSSISAKIAAEYPELAPEALPIAHKL